MSKGIIQEKSASEGRIPESSGRIEDAKGNSTSSKKKDNSICRWQKHHGITREVLEQQFDKNLNDAAKTLEVSPSTLKRACRDCGINRWPTNNRKRSNNSSLNQKQHVQAAAVKKHKGGRGGGAPALQGNITMHVEAAYQNHTVAFPLSSSSSTMKYLEDQLAIRFKIPGDKFSIKYQDHEDKLISIMCDSDVMYCMNVLTSCGKSVIRMTVTLKSLGCNPNPSSISSFGNDFAQPPPNAASPVASLSIDVGPTGERVYRENLEPPNTTPMMFNAGNTSVGSRPQPQGVSDRSFVLGFPQPPPNAASPLASSLSIGIGPTGKGVYGKNLESPNTTPMMLSVGNTSVGCRPQPQGVSDDFGFGFPQSPPNAASPMASSLSIGVSPTGIEVCRKNLESPNTTPIMLNVGNTSVGGRPQPQGCSDKPFGFGFPQPPPNAESPMIVKATYQDATVAFPLWSSSSTMKYLEDELQIRFKIQGYKFSIQYKDDEDEWISIMCDSDVMYCMNVLTSCGKSEIRMKITLKSCPVEIDFDIGPLLASPDASWGMDGRENLKPPNTTPMTLNVGNTSVGSRPQPQGVSDNT